MIDISCILESRLINVKKTRVNAETNITATNSKNDNLSKGWGFH